MNELQHYPFSAYKLNMFDECKKKFWYNYVKKIKVITDKKFFEKGNFIHHVLATYPKKTKFKFKLSTNDDIKGYMSLVEKILKNKNILNLIENCKAKKERPFRVSFDYTIINQGNQKIKYWIKDNTLFWGEIDYIGRNTDGIRLIDWKTGKHYSDKSDDQLKIYALWVFLLSKSVKKITASYFYVEHGIEDIYIYERKNLSEMINYFNNKINTIEQEKEFAKSPKKLCSYCSFLDVCKPFNLNMEKYNGNKRVESSCS